MSKVELFKHKRNEVFKNDHLTRKVELLEKIALEVESKTETIIITDKEGFVKRVEFISKLEDIRTSPIEVELPQDYKSGYYKFDKKTNKLVIDYNKKKEKEKALTFIL